MRIKSQRDFWSGALLTAVGGGFSLAASAYPLGRSIKPGPGYFPLLLAVLLTVLGLIILSKALIVPTADGAPIGKVSWRPLLLVLGSIVLFGVALPVAGLLLTVPLQILLVSQASPVFRWRGALANATVLTGFAWLLFVAILGLPLPVFPTFHAA